MEPSGTSPHRIEINDSAEAGLETPTSDEMKRRVASRLSVTIEVVEETSRATHMLLYLNQLTYQGDAGELLADELRAARGVAGRGRARRVSVGRVSVEEGGAEQAGRARARSLFTLHRSAAPLPIVMAHENDPDKGGCEFALCLDTVRRVCGPPACLFLLAMYATLLRPPFLWARQTPRDLVDVVFIAMSNFFDASDDAFYSGDFLLNGAGSGLVMAMFR